MCCFNYRLDGRGSSPSPHVLEAGAVGEGVSVTGAADSETASVRERQPLLKTLFLPCRAVLCYPGCVSGKLSSLLSSILPIDQMYSFPSLSIALGKLFALLTWPRVLLKVT